jgi:hypothetical protein
MAANPLVGAEDGGSSKEFALELPEGIEAARSVTLVLSNVRLPRNTAAVLRARIAESGAADVPLGSIGVLAESKAAEGTALHAALRIDVTKALKRWRQDHPGISAMKVRVVPYAGAEPLAHLEWSIESAGLTLERR